MYQTFVTLHAAWKSLSSRGRRVLTTYTFVLFCVSTLDGLALYNLSKLLTPINESAFVVDEQFLARAGFVVVMFLVKSVLSVFVTWIGYKAFVVEEVEISDQNFMHFMNQDWEILNTAKISEFMSKVDRGSNALVQKFLLNSASLVAELAGVTSLFIILIYLDWLIALCAMAIFTIFAIIQHKSVSVSSKNAGLEIIKFQKQNDLMLFDAFNIRKIQKVMKSKTLRIHVSEVRRNLAAARMRAMFIETLPRFMMDLLLIVGLIILSTIVVMVRGIENLVQALTIFGIAGFRILPSVVRAQSVTLLLIGNEPTARDGLPNRKALKSDNQILVSSNAEKDIAVSFKDVSFNYASNEMPTVTNISFEIPRGSQCAIVGSSGSGKTTIADLILGLISPTSGIIERNFVDLNDISYVPQETVLTSASFKQNVLLEWSDLSLDEKRYTEVIRLSKIGHFADQVNSEFTVSGGERQRVGIARALYRNPKLLVLDEPSSSLDVETEYEVAKSINELKGHITVVVIAHRLSSLRFSDQIIYIDGGKIQAIGTMSELIEINESFRTKVALGNIEVK